MHNTCSEKENCSDKKTHRSSTIKSESFTDETKGQLKRLA